LDKFNWIKSNAFRTRYAFGKYNNSNNFVYEIPNGFRTDIFGIFGVFAVFWGFLGWVWEGVFPSVLGGLEGVGRVMILGLVRGWCSFRRFGCRSCC